MATAPGTDAHLVDEDGNTVVHEDGAAIPAGSDAVLLAGRDGASARHVKVGAGGELRTDPTGTTIQPVSGPLTDAELRATPVPVSTAALPLPAGAATEVTLATRASEATLEAARVLLASLDGKDFATQTTLVTRATESTLEAARLLLATIDADTSQLDVALSTRATEATLALIKAKTDNIDVALSTRAVTGLTDAELRAAPVPVSAASLPLPSGAATEVTLATLATEAKLEAVRALLATIDADTSQLDVALSTRATEATLALIKAKTDNLDVALSTRAVTGLTDAELRATAVPVSAASLPLPAGAATEATLTTRATEATLEAARVILASLDSKDFSTQTTLAALLAAFSAEDFATQTTLATRASEATLATRATEATLEAARVLLVSIAGEDFATQTTLATRATEATVATLATQVTAAAIQSAIEAIRDTAGIKKITDALPVGANLIGLTRIDSGDASGNVATVDSLNRLLVSSSTPAPPGTDPVETIAQGIVAGTTAVDTDYVVPDGETLTVTQFFGGGETSGKQSKFELYHSNDGGATDGTLLAFGYIGGSNNFRVEANLPFLGVAVGQTVIRMRRERLDGASRELAASWIGNVTVP